MVQWEKNATKAINVASINILRTKENSYSIDMLCDTNIIASILQPSRDDPKHKATKTCWWWYTCFANPLTYLQKSLCMITSRNAHNKLDVLLRLLMHFIISIGAINVIKQSFWRKLNLVKNM
jgi:hypothetical protein